MTCPQCGRFIPTTIAELLTAGVLRCPYCLLQLRIDRYKSSAALRALEKIDAAQRKLDTTVRGMP
jgi:DNA-directed RNA polymerase subunit RPC12/RpoP